ncbi:MAG: 30S ribosomal protein S4, partial [Chloroflexota bacterium]|nr:30S ribosomal protein S4 [Chloroflexota bacterium]
FKTVAEKLARHDTPPWLTLDAANMTGRVVRLPLREEVDMQINEPLIVEFYSR